MHLPTVAFVNEDAEQMVLRLVVRPHNGPVAASPHRDYSPETLQLSSRGDRDEGKIVLGFRATHKPTGLVVAFKRLVSTSEDSIARMRREVEVATSLVHDNVMPIYDAGEDGEWFTMPMASESLEEARDRYADDSALAKIVEDVCQGLQAAHARGFVHRDIKPSNVLRLGEHWVVSDWGLVRRPRGETTFTDRTRTGEAYGTEGFAPPELSVNAHEADESADIYAVRQMIGWALTGQQPLANLPLLPPTGPWRPVVRSATQFEPARRPQSIDEFLVLIREELAAAPAPRGIQKAIELVERLEADNDISARTELVAVAVREPEAYDVYIDVLPRLPSAHIDEIVSSDPAAAREMLAAFRGHLEGEWGRRDFNWANNVILLILRFAAAAANQEKWDLFETSADTLFEWDAAWNRFRAQDSIRPWLARLRGEAARTAARALRGNPRAAGHFAELVDDGRADQRVVAAIEAATGD